MEKGLSTYISHILALAVAMIILVVIATNLFEFYRSTARESQKTQARLISEKIGDNLLKLYTNYVNSDIRPEKGESLTLGRLELTIPEKISNRYYNITLINRDEYWIDVDVIGGEEKESERKFSSVKIFTLKAPKIEEEYRLNNIEIDIEGSVKKTDRIALKYVRSNSGGRVKDKIVMERL